jgi:hypothetical protein
MTTYICGVTINRDCVVAGTAGYRLSIIIVQPGSEFFMRTLGIQSPCLQFLLELPVVHACNLLPFIELFTLGLRSPPGVGGL